MFLKLYGISKSVLPQRYWYFGRQDSNFLFLKTEFKIDIKLFSECNISVFYTLSYKYNKIFNIEFA
jgi:hypothetical protein